MILEVLREITEFLNDGTDGVVAILATISRDPGDPLPTVGTIADETTNADVAQQRLPSFPGIAVNIERIPQLDGQAETITRDGVAEVLIRVGVSSEHTENATRDTSYILRALVASLRRFSSSQHDRNGIEIYAPLDLVVGPTWQPIDDMVVTGAVRAKYQFRETLE
jgi:hypothetical protein